MTNEEAIALLKQMQIFLARGTGKVLKAEALQMAIKALSVDSVEVVRCKDCRWGREACGNIECFADINMPTEYHGYEWFCPNGEREEE